MKACYSRNIACAVVLFSMTVALSFGMSEGEKTKVKGFILTRTADTLTLKTATSGNVTVVLMMIQRYNSQRVLVSARSSCRPPCLSPASRSPSMA